MRLAVLMGTCVLLGCHGAGEAKVELVKDGRSDYVVVLAKQASPSEHRAAAELKRFVIEMSGAVMPTADDTGAAPEKAVYVGDSRLLRALGARIDFDSLGDEGYVIRTVGNSLVIAGGRTRGTMYGVYALLEDVLGCRWYSAKVSKIPRLSDIVVPDLDVTGRPAFEYREPFYTEAFDGDWAARNRCNGGNAGLDVSMGGKISYHPFVHTFASLVPLEKYWDTHPEYYSMIDGKRTRDHTQLCMSNPDVVRIATQTVLGWMRERPDATIYEASHNDWYNNCQCDRCKAIDEEEGSPSGLLLRFVNAIAEEVEKVDPGKMVGTLAYQWTEKPPKITRPRANVRVRLCPIFCCEAHPYETCGHYANKAYVENLRNWAAITSNLTIWHYNTSFAHYLNPFPDLRQLPDSARLYQRTPVKGVFWQGNYSPGGGGEFAALRSYLLAKLSWNPNIDAEAVMRDFVDGYYGAGGQFIWQYIQLLHDKVTDDNIHFQIWAGPDAAYLTPEIVAKSDELLAKAEAAAESDDVRDRIRHARLPIDYVKLMQPIIRKQTTGREPELLHMLDAFVDKCRSYGITNISEGEALDSFAARVAKELGRS